ncbi:cell division protein FtsN [Erwinia billingiae]|uniref:cell division protein FtsN n=1 Tax=Erwinia billingiae TaxID=182337 RepID=UPI0019D13048|nr:cell division protein FtsN [Erwinia billingiae]
MAQKDYVGRGRSTGTRRKKTNSRTKKRSGGGSGVSKIMVVLAVAVLVTFVGGLWFIAHHKKEETPEIPAHKAVGNGLPPKPEERWRYIKELENRQITVPSPVEPSSGGEVQSKTQLTDEQRQLLEQMQSDMRQQPTQLNEVPWNEQTPAQRQQTLQRQQQQSQLQQQSRMPQQQQQAPRQAPVAPVTRATPAVREPAVREPVKQQQAAPAQAPAQTAQQPKTESKPKEAEKSQHWMVQCGSFKGTDQAESIRAQLAFEGFESRITTGGGWNRVVIGPYNSRSSADSTLKRLRGSGHSNCIPLASGG